MNKQEFDERLNKAIETLTKTMTEEFEESQCYKRWRAEEGDTYYYVCDFGGISEVEELYTKTDNALYNAGNYFKTEDEAETHKKRLLATQELKDLAEGFKQNGTGHHITYSPNYGDHKWRFNTSHTETWMTVGNVYFPTKEKAQHAIDTLGEEKLKLIFEVE